MSGQRTFTIWVCPECGYYDADPILRRGPDSSFGPMTCLACGQRAQKAIDYKGLTPAYREARRREARKSGPLMIETKAIEAESVLDLLEEVTALGYDLPSAKIEAFLRENGRLP